MACASAGEWLRHLKLLLEALDYPHRIIHGRHDACIVRQTLAAPLDALPYSDLTSHDQKYWQQDTLMQLRTCTADASHVLFLRRQHYRSCLACCMLTVQFQATLWPGMPYSPTP